jgi:hypothetical protein
MGELRAPMSNSLRIQDALSFVSKYSLKRKSPVLEVLWMAMTSLSFLTLFPSGC